jgi:protein involved in polysaccharide export with SLBB domain
MLHQTKGAKASFETPHKWKIPRYRRPLRPIVFGILSFLTLGLSLSQAPSPGQNLPPDSSNDSLEAQSPYAPPNQPLDQSNPQSRDTQLSGQGSNLNRGLDQPNTRNSDAQANDSRFSRARRIQPDPPTEFQLMVANSTGAMLPIYGIDLFRDSSSTFAPLDRVPVTSDYQIGPGDELLIQLWGQVTLDSRFMVDRSGNIYIPQVGTVTVAGIPFGQMQSYLKAQIGRIFHNFDLNVTMGQLRSIQIFVVGQARRPGSYTISSLSTLVNAIFVTGGAKPQGSLRHIELKRSGKTIATLDLYDFLMHGDTSGDKQLLPGDVIYFPPVGPQIAVAGSVNTPAIYEIKSSSQSNLSAVTSNVKEAIALAGGATNTALDTRVRIEHVDDHQGRSITDIFLNEAGLSSTLQNGDILEVAPIVDLYKDAVTLRGNVANPGRYAWRSGMRVGDLIPDKESLVTREYWIRRGALGRPTLSYLPPCGTRPADSNGSMQSNWSNEYQTSPTPNAPMPGTVMQDARVPDRDCYEEPNQLERNSQAPQSYDQDSYSAIADQSRQSSQSADPGNSQRAQVSSTASAAVANSTSQFHPLNEVKLSAPDIDWSYAVIERHDKQSLTTSLLPFNLGRLVLNGDSSQNLELLPGDVITIFSKADIRVPQSQQTRFVHLEGEFVASGVYSVQPGETLRELVKRVGGFSPDAYLYGSEFTRESTQRSQQQRLREYINQMELQMTTNASNAANRSLSALDAAAAATAASQNQAVIASLRQMTASGRIVLDLKPDSNNVSQLPDIPLEDGDRFIVPHVPATVSVSGAVYNPNSFVKTGDHRLRYYLQLAGGGNRDADFKRAYVVRADGSVISKQQVASWGRDGFESLPIYPGDTIVVPLNVNKGTLIRNIVDIGQIASQFGIAAAAATVVF